MRVLVLCLAILAIVAPAVLPHPLDITITTLQIEPEGLRATTYIHPYQLSLLARRHGLSLEGSDASRLRQIAFEYIDERFRIVGRNGVTAKTNQSFSNERLYEILADGLYVNYRIPLARSHYPVSFHVDLFVEYSRMQTNKVVFLTESGELFPNSQEVVFTAKRREWAFDASSPDFSSEVDDYTDTDGDGLTDRLERLYGLDPHNPDTDGDGYSDLTEISYGWDPFDPVLAADQPKQVMTAQAGVAPGRTVSAESNALAATPSAEAASGAAVTERSPLASNDGLPGGNPPDQPKQPGSVQPQDASQPAGLTHVQEQTGSELESPNLIRKYDVRDPNLPRGGLLARTLERLSSSAQNRGGLGAMIPLLLALVALGFLHAALPGHGNAVLASYLANSDRRYRHALSFIGTFIVTHLAYVTVLAVAVTAVARTFDSAKVTFLLRVVGGTGLLIASSVMIVRGVRALRQKKALHPDHRHKHHEHHDHHHPPGAAPKRRGAALMGFFTGLAPCTYGWALLMMIVSLGRWGMIPLVLLPFALGIFIFLSLLAAGVMILRDVMTSAFSRLQRYSYLASGILLLIFSVVLFAPQIRGF